jgi:hypothetical protein
MVTKTTKQPNPDTLVYLNPLTDFGFKKIFGDKELLIDFLNEIIQENVRIKDVKYRDVYLRDYLTQIAAKFA